MKKINFFFVLFCTFVTLSDGLQKCHIYYKYKSRCLHYDVECLERDEPEACQPIRISIRNPRCPVHSCVSESFKSCFNKMCFCRDSFCKCCKEFLKTLTVTYCGAKQCKKTVYAKFTVKCSDCLNCRNVCSPMKRLPRSWYQRGTIYLSCFAVAEDKIVLYLDNESKFY